MTFSHSFSDLEVVTKHKITCLHKTEIIIAEIKPQQKDFLNSHIKLSLLYIWNWNDGHIDTQPSSFVNHIRFQAKMGKICPRFQTKTKRKPYP